MSFGRDQVIGSDYEVLGLASDGCHYFWIFFFGLHGMSSRAFVGGLPLVGFVGVIRPFGTLLLYSRMVD